MTPEEHAKSIYDQNVNNFRLLGLQESSINYFAIIGAENQIAECETRRHEIYSDEAPQLTEEYWLQVKKCIQSLRCINL